MHKSKRKWLCLDCKRDTKHEHYFVKNEVWFDEARMSENGMLCVDCLECRIRRHLRPEDFTDAFINDPRKNSMTDKLRTRILGEEIKDSNLAFWLLITSDNFRGKLKRTVRFE